jgi:hypothetical protein
MVSLQLVGRSPILRAQVEALEMGSVRSYAKRNPDKAPQVGRRAGRSVTTQVHFNRAILKGAPWNDCETACIIKTIWTGICHTHGGAPKIGNRLGFHVVEFEFVKSEPHPFLLLLTP